MTLHRSFCATRFPGTVPIRIVEWRVVYARTLLRPAGRARPTDVPRVIDLLAKVNYRGYVVLEYEAKPDPYEAVPKHLRELRTAIGARS